MRINPVMVKQNKLSYNAQNTQFEKSKPSNNVHCYTGNACEDLAYASLFDNAIAQDLKLMGLI